MRILVTGREGQVDTSVQHLADSLSGNQVFRLGLPEIDLSRPETLDSPVRTINPDVIISSAAYTAVDRAESEPALAMAINGEAPGRLARLARELDIPIIHLSTDYVFPGTKRGIYDENDVPAPVSVYGQTKLAGENAIRAETDNHVILRTAWVYSPYGGNFVKTMLRLGETRGEINVVADQYGCPTYAPEIARALLEVAQHVTGDASAHLRGIFNLTGQGETSWAGFARQIFAESEKYTGRSVTVNDIPTSAYPTAATRPLNSRLNGAKFTSIYGLTLDPWQVSLAQCLDALLTPVRDKV